MGVRGTGGYFDYSQGGITGKSPTLALILSVTQYVLVLVEGTRRGGVSRYLGNKQPLSGGGGGK